MLKLTQQAAAPVKFGLRQGEQGEYEMTENSCYTYFRIAGYFDPDVITEQLDLQPNEAWKIGDKRHDGTRHDASSWVFGYCDQYDVLVENQMHTTIQPLLDKVERLNEIREKFDVSFTLEIVPTVYAENTSPCLAPSMEVIDFCHLTKTQIDIDLYVMDE
ncbi:MAG: DUF4279 domain-containing protein [Oscillospiraceae bacterium]|nr:DUF4279 domain-containing protein [Oscillospiraceae bacterium]